MPQKGVDMELALARRSTLYAAKKDRLFGPLLDYIIKRWSENFSVKILSFMAAIKNDGTDHFVIV